MGASSFVLDTIEKGYVIPFIDQIPLKRVTSSPSLTTRLLCTRAITGLLCLINAEFVNEAVNELVSLGCVVQVPFKPYIVSPLSMATNSSGKTAYFRP